MKLKPRRGKEIPGIPGATLPPKPAKYTEKEREEILERLLQDGDDEGEDKEFVPQQDLVVED